MQTNLKQLILAACLCVTIACAGLTGCQSEDRTAGTRLDDRLTEHRVKSALDHAPVYKFTDLHVQVYDGIAQLSGFADTPEQKQYATKIASQVQGVRQVLDGIAVKPPEIITPTGYKYGRQYPPPPSSANMQPNNNTNAPIQNDLNNQNQNRNTSNPNQP